MVPPVGMEPAPPTNALRANPRTAAGGPWEKGVECLCGASCRKRGGVGSPRLQPAAQSPRREPTPLRDPWRQGVSELEDVDGAAGLSGGAAGGRVERDRHFFPLLQLGHDLKARIGSYLTPFEVAAVMSACTCPGLSSFSLAIEHLELPSSAGGMPSHTGATVLLRLTSASGQENPEISLARLIRRFPGLRSLSLRVSPWSQPWSQSLSSVFSGLSHLRVLRLDHNPLDSQGMSALAAAALKANLLSKVEVLSLRHARIEGPLATHALSILLGVLPRLRELHLDDNPGMGDAGVAAVISVTELVGSLRQLQLLSLERVGVGDGAIAAISRAVRIGAMPQLTTLRVAGKGGQVTDEGLKLLAQAAPHAKHLQVLRVFHKNKAILGHGSVVLFESMAQGGFPALTDIDISAMTVVSAEGVQAMAALGHLLLARPLPCLEEIRLGDRGWNDQAERGVVELLNVLVGRGFGLAPVLPGLRAVVSHYPMGARAIVGMAQALGAGLCPSVSKMALNLGALDDHAAQHMSSAFSASTLPHLTYLELLLRPGMQPSLSPSVASALMAAICSLPSLETFSLICATELLQALARGDPSLPEEECRARYRLNSVRCLTCYGMGNDGMRALKESICRGRTMGVQCLCLGKDENVTAEGVMAVLQAISPSTMPSLFRLGLTSCPALTDTAVMVLIEALASGRLTSLHTLILADCPRITVGAVLLLMRTLLQHRPKGLLRVGLPDVPRLTANADFCRLLKALQDRNITVAVR